MPFSQSQSEAESRYRNYASLFERTLAPFAWLDFDQLRRNIATIRAASGGMRVRIGSKSIRSRAVMKYILASGDPFRGVLAMSAREACWLAAQGFDDLLVAYPQSHPSELVGLDRALYAGSTITLMADLPEHLDLYESYAKSTEVILPVAIDLDVSSDFRVVYFGVRRSAIKSTRDLNRILAARTRWPHLRFVGLMAYEAQIAGVQDQTGQASKDRAVALLKKRSMAQVLERRAEAVACAKKNDVELGFVNGGGTGSMHFTSSDPSVTELAVGSGFYAPALFDGYDGLPLAPAAGFALRVTRRPAPSVITCTGGGYPASGPAGVDRLPVPYLPQSLELLPLEGAGEVQTPLRTTDRNAKAARTLKVGDLVFFRHRKAGELCERFGELHAFSESERPYVMATYRGEGRTFT